jgi:peptide/nickel transport system substrate-binding protein
MTVNRRDDGGNPIRRRRCMQRRLWLLAGAAAAVLLLAASATATSSGRTPALSAGGTPAAAPFAQARAKVPTTTAGRKAANVVVFGAEQDINGFNTNLSCCQQLWANWLGAEETNRGAYVQNAQGVWVPDLVSSASANRSGVTYTIKPNANWYWGGKKVPVTYKDFVYTLQQIDDPKNDVASRTGFSNLDPTRFTHKGLKQVTLYWKAKNCSTDFPCGPYADWQSIFSATSLYPSFALQGLDFNKIWTSCICGSDGQPVSDGPYYLSNYTKGQGTVLKANPFWSGKKPSIQEVDFKLIADTNSEAQAMRGGEVDAISPSFGLYLAPLKSTPGLTFDQVPGYYFEHLEFREGNAKGAPSVNTGSSNPLLRAPWFRQAIAMGIDRQSIINTIYGELAGGTKPMDNGLYYATEAAYKPDFARWNFNPQKALALMAKHCTGGPASVDPSNTKISQCSGFPATFNWTWTAGNSVRTTSEQIVKAEMKSIGIQVNEKPLPANVVFGPNGIPSGGFDVAEFAWVTSGDPGDFNDIWRCQGTSNYTGFCSRKLDQLMKAGNSELNPTKRQAIFQAADRLFAQNVPIFPMYQRPTPLIHKSTLLGLVNNPASIGPFWNIEDWHWK